MQWRPFDIGNVRRIESFSLFPDSSRGRVRINLASAARCADDESSHAEIVVVTARNFR